MRALVLSGGAAKGAFQVGVLIYLISNLQYKYSIFSGVSVGALNCSFLSMYSNLESGIFDLKNVWKKIKPENVLKRHFPFGRLHGLKLKNLYDSSPIKHLVESLIDLEKIRTTNNIVNIGSVCINNGKYITINQSDDNFVKYVLASCSFPGLFAPVEINNNLYLDGGIKSITPLVAAINSGATDIDVILTSPENNTSNMTNCNSIDILKRSIDLMIDSIIESDIRKAELYNKLLNYENILNKRQVNINIIRPDKILLDDSFTFDPDKTQDLIDIGYKKALEIYG